MTATTAPPKTPFAVDDFAAELAPRLQGDVRTDLPNRVLYSTDASLYQVMPLAVVMAESNDDVVAAMESAAKFRLPIMARGSGTSLAGQAINEAVIIDMTHLDRIIHLNAPEGWVKAQAGTILARLNGATSQRGLKFGPDPATDNRAVLGGVIGNNSTGSHSVMYGMAADHVISVDMVLADGSLATFGPMDESEIGRKAALDTLEGQIYRHVPAILREHEAAIRERLPQTWRRCGGYNLDRLIPGMSENVSPLPPIRWTDGRFNLARLITGSEATLGTILSATVNLTQVPKFKGLAILHFDTINAALESVPSLLEMEPSAIEISDKFQMDLCRESEAWRSRLTFVQGLPEAILITEFYGDSAAEVDSKLDKLDQHIKAAALPVGVNLRLTDPAAQANVWGVRKAGLGLLMSMRGDAKPVPFIEDVAVHTDHLAGYIRDLQAVSAELDTNLAIYGHASAGCLHVRPIVNLKNSNGVITMERIAQATADLVLKYKGIMSSEHGDGRARSWLNPHIYGEEVTAAFAKVKHAFDPDNRLNPGNVINAGPMTENLRFGGDYATVPVYENLDWSADFSFAGAVEMCNGAGVCRQLDGAMCPTYQATREEEHSTRGRANLLRAAMSGVIPRDQLFGDRIGEALELCISCKSCKSECPSAVDMARIKLEWQSHYYRHHRPSLRTWLFANMPTFSALGSRMPTLTNAVLGAWPVRVVMDAALGIDKRRKLPEFEQSFMSKKPEPTITGKKVVLYVDTWANFQETSIPQAAFDVLTAAGYEVIIPSYACCGRTYLSKGFVEKARVQANKVMEILAPYGRAGVPIVGLEPSCILTVRDEHQYLSDHPDRAAVASHTFTFEEFAALHADEWADLFEPDHEPCLLHGHCHQKALVGTDPARKALGLAHEHVSETDSGCCGMAGAFGYEKEHYELSRDIAFQKLIPAMGSTREEVTLVAAGTSCRHQVKDFANRKAIHPAEVLARRLKK